MVTVDLDFQSFYSSSEITIFRRFFGAVAIMMGVAVVVAIGPKEWIEFHERIHRIEFQYRRDWIFLARNGRTNYNVGLRFPTQDLPRSREDEARGRVVVLARRGSRNGIEVEPLKLMIEIRNEQRRWQLPRSLFDAPSDTAALVVVELDASTLRCGHTRRTRPIETAAGW
jgi:hypothetical protein